MKTRHHRKIHNKTMKHGSSSKHTSKDTHMDAVIKKHNIKNISGKKITRTEALIRLNKGIYGLHWKDKAHTLNCPEELVIANVMQGHSPFKHHVEYKERKPGHKFKL